jgi:hypothetical protein
MFGGPKAGSRVDCCCQRIRSYVLLSVWVLRTAVSVLGVTVSVLGARMRKADAAALPQQVLSCS